MLVYIEHREKVVLPGQVAVGTLAQRLARYITPLDPIRIREPSLSQYIYTTS